MLARRPWSGSVIQQLDGSRSSGFPGLTAADELGLRNLLAQFSEAPIDVAVIERAIEIRKSVRIKIPGALVAATALIYEAHLVTRNTVDFKNIHGIFVLDPATM